MRMIADMTGGGVKQLRYSSRETYSALTAMHMRRSLIMSFRIEATVVCFGIRAIGRRYAAIATTP